MSQSVILQGEYNKKITHATRSAAIHQAVSELVAVHTGLTGGNKKIGKNSHLNYAIESLRQCGVDITKDALKNRVSRACQAKSPQETIIEVNHGSLPSSDMSSLSSQSKNEQEIEELQSLPKSLGGPKGSTN